MIAVAAGSARLKLTPPQAIHNEVERALVADLDRRAGTADLVLVDAPAGFGKTSLLRALHDRVRSRGEPAFWVSLDTEDNDPRRFLEYLGAALGAYPPRDGQTASHPGAGDGLGTLDEVLARVDELTEAAQPFSVFLDEVEAMQDEAGVAVIRDLSLRMLARGTLFLAGRRMPDLQNSRRRTERRVLEVGPEELRFSVAETEDLLGRMVGKRLPRGLVASVHERTEGWAAALQLAGLSLSSQARRGTFSGSSVDLGRYGFEEILASQPFEVQDLMLRASVLDTVSAELCDAVLGLARSAELLRRIARDNLFLFDVGEGTFRFHSLFREFLRRELTERRPAAAPGLHRRAADWFAARDEKTSAIRHALSSGAPEFAADTLEGYAQSLTAAGRLATVTRAAAELPDGLLDARPHLKAYYAACLVGTFQHRRADPLIAELASPGGLASLDEAARGAVLFAIPFQLLLQDRFAEALPVCEEHLTKLPPDASQPRAALMNIRNICLLHLRRYREIEDAEFEVRALASGETAYGLVYAECVAGMSELAQGRLHHAIAIFEAALATAIEESSPTSAPTAVAAACLAEARYERGDLEGAQELLDRYLSTISHVGVPDAVIQAHVLHVRLEYRRNGYADACHALNQLKRLGYERDLLRVVAAAGAEHSRLALVEGDVVSARRYLELAEASAPYVSLWDESGITLLARLLVVEGRAHEAIDLLGTELARLESTNSHRHMLKLRSILAIALSAAGESSAAMDTLAACLAQARGEAYVQIFADEGASLTSILCELLATRLCEPTLTAYAELLLDHAGDRVPNRSAETVCEPSPLSCREFEVLTHIAEGLSNQAIAEALFLSLPTVKTHVVSILGKLSAKNRTQAVAAARRRKLLMS